MQDTLARTLTLEVGKPIRQSRNELNGLLPRLDFFLAEAARVLREEKVFADVKQNLEERISHEPLGVDRQHLGMELSVFRRQPTCSCRRCSPATRCCTSLRNSPR